MLPAFVAGAELARRLHRDVVGPLLVAELGEDGYAAALVGPGSEVLGFDTVRSTDHEWGPRPQVFLLGVDPRTGFGPEAWLATITQALAEVRSVRPTGL